MMRPIACLVFLGIAAAAAPALGQGKAIDGDAMKLQGTWTTKGPDGSPLTLAFAGDKVTITLVSVSGEQSTIAGDFTVDETVTPRAMDWRKVKVKERELPDLTAIYEFVDADTLKLAGVGGSTRPKEFVEKGKELPGMRANTMILTRSKDDAEEVNEARRSRNRR